ncbi:MAG: hypothetical protein AAGK00_16220 [Pseudomonadota bacterium]
MAYKTAINVGCLKGQEWSRVGVCLVRDFVEADGRDAQSDRVAIELIDAWRVRIGLEAVTVS